MRLFAKHLLLGLFLLSPPCLARTSIAVITSKDSHVDALTKKQVNDLFLGDDRFLPNGERMQLVDQAKAAPITTEFYEVVSQMSLKEVARHWAKIIFTGRGMPPEQVEGGDQNVKAWVKSKKNSIGYIYSDAVDDSVKVLLTFPP